MSFGLKAEDQVAVTGLVDDVDAEIVDLRAELYDFKGKSQVKTCIKLVLKADGVEETAEEYYSVGDPNKVVPDDDGLGCSAAPGSKMSGYNTKGKAGIFLAALATLLGDKVPAKFDGYRGMRFHWDRKPFDTSFVKNRDPKQNEATILVPTKLLSGAAAPKAAAGSVNGAGDAEVVIRTALKDMGGEGTANAVGKHVFKTQAKHPNIKNIVKLLSGDDKTWLSADDRPWSFDAGSNTLTLVG